MAATARSAVFFVAKSIQRVADFTLFAAIIAPLLLFGLQFPHSSRMDDLWFVARLHRFVDPILTTAGSWIDLVWPPKRTKSFLPLGVSFAVWLLKIGVDALFLRAHGFLNKLMPGPQPAEGDAIPGLMQSGPVKVDSAKKYEQALRRYREIEQELKSAPRKRCTFLSIDVVGSTQLKLGEKKEKEQNDVAATFQAYEEMLKKIFNDFGAWKQAWTPDGVMVCFLQADLAVAAAQRVLQSLEKFNESENKLRTAFRVRCGINEGEVVIFEDRKLEKIADRAIDVAGHMQKLARPNTLWLGADVYNLFADKSGFEPAGEEVDGYSVYEWSVETGQPHARKPKAALPVEPLPMDREPALTRPAPVKKIEKGNRIGRYEILQELGRGAMGAVYKARDPQIGRTVAVKIILTANLRSYELEEFKRRFYREAQMTHPGIVTIYDISEDETGQPFLVMEFVEGTPLESLLSHGRPGAGGECLSLRSALDIAIQVAEALDYAHRRGVIHRDLKPANILITPEGKAKIADFGIAKLSGTQMTQAGVVVGTPAFMAPEQFTGGGADARSDIFALGVVLYWMCTGQRPFSGETFTQVAPKVVHDEFVSPRVVNAELPPELDAVIARCLAKKREERYSTARELALDLEALKARQPVAAGPSSATG